MTDESRGWGTIPALVAAAPPSRVEVGGAQVRLFLSTYVNKVDRKGRVSVPAPFRTVLSGQNSAGIVAYPAFKHPAISCSGLAWVDEMAALLETLPEFSDEYDKLASMFGEMKDLSIDPEGRIVLPEDMLSLAGITEQVAFVGLSKTFQIWEPEALKAHQDHMRQLKREQGMAVPAARALAATVPTGGAA
jgi:MraZ protein